MQKYQEPLRAGSGGALEVGIFDNPRDQGRVTITACAFDLRTRPLTGAAGLPILTGVAGTVPATGVARLELTVGQVATVAPFAPASCEFRVLYSRAGEVDRLTDWIAVELLA